MTKKDHLHLNHHFYHQKKSTHSDINNNNCEESAKNQNFAGSNNFFLDLFQNSSGETTGGEEEANSLYLECLGGLSSSSSSAGGGDNNNHNIMLISSQSNVNYNFSNFAESPSVQDSSTKQQQTVVKQPQLVASSSTNNTMLQNQNDFQTTEQKSLNNINNFKISSFDYLDDSNLKIAIVEYNDLLKLIKLQNSIDQNEWLAFNTKMYFEQINVLYGAIADHCTPQSCPTMNAPLNNQFHLLDEKGKKCKYSASQYIDTILTQTAKIISDEQLFPSQVGHPFAANFESLIKKLHKNLYQILAHMYHAHYKELVYLKLNTYVNSIYFHLLIFSKSFNILEEKDIEIMHALNKSLMNKYMTQQQQATLLNQRATTSSSIHQPVVVTAPSPSSSSSGFSFFKKKLNFNLMA